MSGSQDPSELHALQTQIDELRAHVVRLEAETIAAKQEAHRAHDEVLHLRDQVVAAERDQQDLRTTRARLARVSVRGLIARILNRP